MSYSGTDGPVFFSYRPGLISMQHTTLNTLLYNFPLTINDISLLVDNGTNCLHSTLQKFLYKCFVS